jgi:hypothetical protein
MFSPLQQFILLKALERGQKIERSVFRVFYHVPRRVHGGAKEKYQEEIITKSLMSLIDREMLVGYGKRTPHKWFVTHVRLTKKGIRKATEILESRQAKLPFK